MEFTASRRAFPAEISTPPSRKSAALLPRSARMVTASPQEGGLLEFEVLVGSAAYGRGERFYMTRSEAERALLLKPKG